METFALAAVLGTKTIYAGTDQVMRSDNGGLSWINLGSLAGSRTHIVIDPMNDKLLFLTAMVGSSSDYRSANAGRTWFQSSLYVYQGLMTFDPLHKLIYRVTGSAGPALFRSSDNGITWQPFGQSYHATNDPLQLLPDPNDASKLWLI